MDTADSAAAALQIPTPASAAPQQAVRSLTIEQVSAILHEQKPAVVTDPQPYLSPDALLHQQARNAAEAVQAVLLTPQKITAGSAKRKDSGNKPRGRPLGSKTRRKSCGGHAPLTNGHRSGGRRPGCGRKGGRPRNGVGHGSGGVPGKGEVVEFADEDTADSMDDDEADEGSMEGNADNAKS